ncbi:protein kinase [Streptomyces sp. HPF1205]|uniref:protein kinase domain-containing protein n=1 Tax=Streptomyces sp. HPF1205 TaxID=2873262 RepID=UPI001CEC1BCE|nr:protein kinase [Streptomyces sp. HPF1205]
MADPNETTTGTGASESSGEWRVGSLVGEGRYRLARKLGRGGMADVYAAEDVRLGRVVAVKLLRGDLAEDPVSKARFTREAQSVAGLNHHAVVAVYDSGEDRTPSGTVPYIVMELVEGHTIKDLLTGPTPPPVDQALLIVSGVLEALAYSHQHGIVHRDIKPANAIITTTGAVKVMDFGIARALHGASTTMTQTGMVMGTPQYLSPEQALGKTVDHRSDLYATGCMLYELLTLRPPFVGETPLSVVYQHVQDEPQLPSAVSGRVPPELDGLVMRALAKDPDDRFQTAEEMGAVVGYAYQALTQQGGWTGGMWDTGAVTSVMPHAGAPGGTGPGTRVAPAAAGAAAGAMGSTMATSRIPAGAADGGGYGEGYGADHRPPGNRWIKPVLFTVAAVMAIALGVFLATRHHGSGNNPADTRPPSATHDSGQSSGTPSDQPTDTGEASTAPDTSGNQAPPTKWTTKPTTATPTTTPPTPTTTPPTTPTTTAPTPTETTTPPASPSSPAGTPSVGTVTGATSGGSTGGSKNGGSTGGTSGTNG